MLFKYRFVGKVHFQPGWWVGVQYDEPTGKNDGSVGGKRNGYSHLISLTCPIHYGTLIRMNFFLAENCMIVNRHATF